MCAATHDLHEATSLPLVKGVRIGDLPRADASPEVNTLEIPNWDSACVWAPLPVPGAERIGHDKRGYGSENKPNGPLESLVSWP